jgi:AraC-like DNA-binding protein
MTFQPKSATVLEGRFEWAQVAPHPALARWVSSYWTLDAGPGKHVVRTLPDACIDLTLQLEGKPAAFVAGAQKRPHNLAREGRTHLFGARLLPGAAALLGIRVAELAEEWVPLEAFLSKTVAARLVRDVARSTDIRDRAAALDAFLTERLFNRELDGRLSSALRTVFARHGNITVTELARSAGAHPRTLTRLFERGVGLSPKRFARIVRLQSALRSLPDDVSWASVAREYGYADQAHFIREVRDLFGAPPRALVKLAARTQ